MLCNSQVAPLYGLDLYEIHGHLESYWVFDKKKQKVHACVDINFGGEVNYTPQGAFRQKKKHSVTKVGSPGCWYLIPHVLGVCVFFFQEFHLLPVSDV